MPFQRPQAEVSGSADERKAKRHARREQLYVAIRETMTRAGVLSASYKFKVLSLDQGGNEFLVMMDLVKASAAPTPRLGEIEALMVQDAKQRFEITVPAVYWRVLEVDVVKKSEAHAAPASDALAKPVKPQASRYEPIQADEVTAFRQALLAASARSTSVAPEKRIEARRGLRYSPQVNDFADTERAESAASPGLSNTQYGELN
ncbi:hypothetical protein SAMN05216344_10420 [Polaromonas sp. OV174]|nr:hypothetical protein SAMN05216344_10420 [Polaromonas sp. OV174]